MTPPVERFWSACGLTPTETRRRRESKSGTNRWSIEEENEGYAMANRLEKFWAQLVVAGLMIAAGGALLAGPAMAYTGTADDLTQMQQLLAQYANSLDGDDPEGYVAVFTTNAHWRGATLGCYTGRAQIKKIAINETKKLAAPGQFPHSHMTVLGHVIFDDKDHAHAHETNILIGSQEFV